MAEQESASQHAAYVSIDLRRSPTELLEFCVERATRPLPIALFLTRGGELGFNNANGLDVMSLEVSS